MSTIIVSFLEWIFEVDKEITQQTYKNLQFGGSDTCGCTDCANYVNFRDKVFPQIVLDFFKELGVDYTKDVELLSYDLPGNFSHVGGWFHFKGRILQGPDCRIPLPSGGSTLNLSKVKDNFSIGFTKADDLSFFGNETDLVQIEFEASLLSETKS